MCDLIVMTRPNTPLRRGSLKQGGADILFFTGVRYDRSPDVVAALASVTPVRRATKARRRPSKRDDIKSA